MSRDSFLWKIGGEAGFGIMTVGFDFARIAARHGYNTADYAEYPSLIRGGHNTYEVHFSPNKVHSSKHDIDMLVCLNKETYEHHKKRLHAGSIVIYDAEAFQIGDGALQRASMGSAPLLCALPIRRILREQEGSMVMINTITFGASLAMLSWPLESLLTMIQEAFGEKGEKVVEVNHRMAKLGYDHMIANYKEHIVTDFPAKHNVAESKLILTGNEAFALGAVVADCRLYCAYPMTPSSAALTQLADWAASIDKEGNTTGMVVRHAEDEISVINTALGSSFAGARSAVGTSGGGFALMVEAVSFAGIAEIPIVVLMGQRPGPATGLPTWTEQGDLLFTVHSGHGEFPKIVLAAGDIEEMYQLTTQAFDLADIYQTPVIILSDKHISESHWSTSELEFKLFSDSYTPDRGKVMRNVSPETVYQRYEITDDGISPMLIPGQKAQHFQTNSYEHSVDGHSNEGRHNRIEQVDKRARKEATYLKQHFKMPKIFGNLESADTVFVSWGSNKGAILDAMNDLEKVGQAEKEQPAEKVAYIHFTHMYPLPEKEIQQLFEPILQKCLLIENNSRGQLGELLRELTGVHIEKRFLKYDGRQIFKEEIVALIKK